MMKPIIGYSNKIVDVLRKGGFESLTKGQPDLLARAIDDSVKFYLGEYAQFLEVKNTERKVEHLMPYDIMVVEYSCVTDQGNQAYSVCVFHKTSEYSIDLIQFQVINGKPAVYEVGASIEIVDNELGFYLRRYFGDDNERREKEIAEILKVSVNALQHMADVLECKNVAAKNMSVSKSMNNKRIKKGKLPLYEYKVLTINNSIYAPCINVKGNPDGNTRLHLRRGHIRNHPTAGKVWVTQCVVGNADHGVVDKDYRVKGGQS